MIVDVALAIIFFVLFFWLLAFPFSAWIVVHIVYPRWLRRFPGEPDFPVNVIVPCKGSNAYLAENLKAYLAQDYPRYTVTFVTNTPDDPANAVIASLAQGDARVRHLVAGQSTSCAGKVHAMLVSINADKHSDVFLFGDSDGRPEPDWVREMARPYLDPRVSVATSHRWVQAEKRGIATSLYTVLSGDYCIYLATPFLALVWGGAFGLSRKAYGELRIEEVWSTTASDDVALSNRMAEMRVRPFFVPRGLCPTVETIGSLREMSTWFNRQALTGKLHEIFTWIAGLVVESLVCLTFLGSLVLLIVEAATGTLEYHALAAPVILFAIAACSLIAKLTYADKRDIPLWQWVLAPFLGHFIIASSFWASAFQSSTMTWGSFTYTVGRDKKVQRIEAGPAAARAPMTSVIQRWDRIVQAIVRRTQGARLR